MAPDCMMASTNDEVYLPRILDISGLLSERSVFLFGPRQTGKSAFLRHQLVEPPALVYNLLDRGLLPRLMADPTMMRSEIAARGLRGCVVVVDEVQRLPELLDEVHLLIEERRIRFLLTGSSARKLRRAGTNLLGGRGRDRMMHPFVYPEVSGHGFTLERMMLSGMLPPHFLSKDPDEDLAAYVDRYLAEEIAAEGAARSLPAFARFLQTAATMNTRMVNYTHVAGDAQVPRQTVQQWFQVLRDTLVAFELPPYTVTVKRKAISTAKLYFFDPGVVRMLRRLPTISPSSADFGEFFEHFLVLEVRAWIDYRSPRTTLHYWRSTSDYEVDLVVGGSVAIEVKATERPQDQHLRSLRAIREEKGIVRAILVCRESRPRLVGGIEIMPWTHFLGILWGDHLLRRPA